MKKIILIIFCLTFLIPTHSFSSNIINLGGQAVNLDTISNQNLNTIIQNLSSSQINNSLSQLTSSQLNTLIPKLPFQALNQTFGDLTGGSLDQVMRRIDPNILERVLPNMVDSTLDNVFSSLSNSTLDNVLENLSGSSLNNIFRQLEAGSIDQVLSSLGEGTLNTVLSSLGEGSLNNIFSNIDSGLVNDIFGSLTNGNLNDVLENLAVGSLNNVMGGLTDTLANEVFSVLGSDAINNVLGNTAGNILNQVMGGVDGNILENVVNNASATVLESVSELPVVEDMVNNLGLNTVIGNSGPLGGLVGGIAGLFVPVVEQNGQLMTHNRNIDTQTLKIQELSVQICTHLKAIRRIQSAFEKKEFVDDRAAKRELTKRLEDYRIGVVGDKDSLKSAGYKSIINGNEVTSSIFPENIEEYIYNVRKEAANVFYYKLSKTNNLYKDDIKNKLAKNDEANSYNPLQSTITPEELEKLEKAPQNIAGSEGMKLLKKLIQPQNNAIGSYLIAQERLNVEKNVAEQNARQELLASGGYLPTRECIEPSEDRKICLKWKTIVPGSSNKNTIDNAMQNKVDQSTNADNDTAGAILEIGTQPSVEEVARGVVVKSSPNVNNRPFTSSNNNQTNPTNIDTNNNQNNPNPNNNTNSIDWSRYLNIFNQTLNNQSQNGNDIDLSLFINILNTTISQSIQNQKPLVELTFTSPSLQNIQSGQVTNKINLVWTSPNATQCLAGNNWLSKDSTGNKIIKTKGANLNKFGSLVINYPLFIEFNLSRIRNGETISYNFDEVENNSNLTSQSIKITINNNEIVSGDTWRLVLNGKPFEVTTDSNNLEDLASKLNLSAFSAEDYTADVNKSLDGKLAITIYPRYKITCTNNNGSTEKELLIERE